jgi:hypothetical protein
MKPTPRFRIGIILLSINHPFGWGGIALCTALALHTGRREFYFYGMAAYALSWVILGLGLWLTGREGIQYLRTLYRKIWNFFLHRSGQSPLTD